MITLHLHHAAPAADADHAFADDSRVPDVAAMFGLGLDDDPPATIVPPTQLTLRPGQIVFVTGPSGGGKSTLLRLVADALARRDDALPIPLDRLPDPPADRPLVDAFPGHALDEVLRAFALAGLGDAFVMLRRPAQLSDGQRHRLRLAQAVLQLSRCGGDRLPVVLADEFGATLDRVTARAVAANLRRWSRATPACFVVATTHDDLLEPLAPDVLIDKGLAGALTIAERASPVSRRGSAASR